VAISDGVITAVGDLSSIGSRRTLDCTGKTVTPGFIDIHSHAGWLLPEVDHGTLLEPFVRQGMTSLVAGNCGFSPAPLTSLNEHSALESSRLVVDRAIALGWRAMQEFLDVLERGGVSLNVVQLVGHGTVRAAATGPLEPAAPSEAELRQMEQLARTALDDGCVGISSGLAYPPGIFARHDGERYDASARAGRVLRS